MTMITPDDLRKVSQLARLEIPEKDLATYADQIEKILEYIDQLQSIDTTNVPPTSRAVEVINVLREDSVEVSKIRDSILDLAPKREGDFYRVPKINNHSIDLKMQKKESSFVNKINQLKMVLAIL